MSFRSAEHLRSVLESAKHIPYLRRLEIEGFKDETKMGDYFPDMTTFFRLPSLRQLLLWGHPSIKTLPEQLGSTTLLSLFEQVLFVCPAILQILQCICCPCFVNLPCLLGSSNGSFLLFFFGLPGATLIGEGCNGRWTMGQCLSPAQGAIEPE